MLRPIVELKRAMATFARKLRELLHEQPILRREYEYIKNDISLRTPGNPVLFGYKVYSQFDEDGIIAHIFSRLGAGDRIFVEIGCSDGLENNTHALLLQGWRGMWVDADTNKLRFIARHVPASPRLIVKQEFVSVENVSAIISNALTTLEAGAIDLLSIDIDGDDLNVLLALLDHLKPRVICAEYNAKFPPPMKIAVHSKANEFWTGDDYHGMSLSLLAEALQARNYRLISCGASGVNAFFVQDRDAGNFPTFSVEELFQPARFYLKRMASGHPPSLKFLADALSE
jgi:hypothetical protein